MKNWTPIAAKIEESIGCSVNVTGAREAGGGCINEAFVLESDRGAYFIKCSAPDRLEMFVAEAEGLRELASTGTVRVPTPVCWGIAAGASFLVLEYLDLAGPSGTSQEELGRRLAMLHRVTRSKFGWHRNNTIGSTPQLNSWSDSWVEFWRTRRLGFQLETAGHNGHRRVASKGDRVLDRLGSLFADHVCAPSLCHGDLWSGNVGATRAGDPVIFDPAVYFGDRETDIAMTELFGGFAPSFYAAYADLWPLPAGYALRRSLYNLYHVLNHLNLFGGGYAIQAEQLMDRLLAE
jgi:protein-ribulosamine 3-kinase